MSMSKLMTMFVMVMVTIFLGCASPPEGQEKKALLWERHTDRLVQRGLDDDERRYKNSVQIEQADHEIEMAKKDRLKREAFLGVQSSMNGVPFFPVGKSGVLACAHTPPVWAEPGWVRCTEGRYNAKRNEFHAGEHLLPYKGA